MAEDHHAKAQVQQKLDRRILHGLACEWQTAVDSLKPIHRQHLHKPLFSLRDLKTRWGYWSAHKREICLSRNLVRNYSWDSIRDVLLHEMAHQLAHQLFGASTETAHGPSFKQACDLLCIDSVASENYIPLHNRLRQDAASQHDKLMLRIKKLMALAESKNRFEAEAAMAKAHELIAKYNIQIYRQQGDRQFFSVFVGSPALRHPREDYHLANLLQDFYFVRGIWVPAYVLAKGKMGRVLEVNGTAQNIKIAAYVYDFIRQFIDAQWRDYNQEKRLNRYCKTDFAVGVIEGFRHKLELKMIRPKTKSDLFALIKTGDPQLEKYFKFKYPYTASVKKAASQRDARILNDGKKLGKKLVIARGICEKKSAKPLLITRGS